LTLPASHAPKEVTAEQCATDRSDMAAVAVESASVGEYEPSGSEIEQWHRQQEPQDTPPPPFKVRCLGAFQVEAAGRPVTNWKVQKARELLAYLVARGGVPVPREEAWEALWPDQDPGNMQRVLSDTAYHLRRTLKESLGGAIEPLVTQGQRYHLNTGIFRVDLAAFEAHMRRATTLSSVDALTEYERAISLYRGSLFGAEPFEWSGPFRQEYEAKFLKAAHTAAKLAQTHGIEQQAMSFYRAILAHDPIDEGAARGLMQCYGSLGDTNGVRKVYKTLVEALRRELEDSDAQPLPETSELWHRLVSS
jgi:LuxR family maltose regulon positive regulatory protein